MSEMAEFSVQDQLTSLLLLQITPSSCIRMKASWTAQESFYRRPCKHRNVIFNYNQIQKRIQLKDFGKHTESIVKQALSQSRVEPSFFSWWQIRSPFLQRQKINVVFLLFTFKSSLSHYFLYSLIFPFPDFLEEIFPAQIMTAHALLSHQLFLDHHLGCNAGVVTARVPQGGLTLHPVPAQTGWEISLAQLSTEKSHHATKE